MTEGLARRHRGRILTSLMLLLFAVGVVPLLGTSYNLVTRSRRKASRSTRTSSSSTRRGACRSRSSIYVQSLRSQVAAIAHTLEVGAVDGSAAPDPRHEVPRALRGGESPFLYVSVVDAATAAGPARASHLQEPAHLSALEEGVSAAREGKADDQQPIISTSLQEPVIVLSEPVAGEEKTPQGVGGWPWRPCFPSRR